LATLEAVIHDKGFERQKSPQNKNRRKNAAD
jgi:hypothetical protein